MKYLDSRSSCLGIRLSNIFTDCLNPFVSKHLRKDLISRSHSIPKRVIRHPPLSLPSASGAWSSSARDPQSPRQRTQTGYVPFSSRQFFRQNRQTPTNSSSACRCRCKNLGSPAFSNRFDQNSACIPVRQRHDRITWPCQSNFPSKSNNQIMVVLPGECNASSTSRIGASGRTSAKIFIFDPFLLRDAFSLSISPASTTRRS